MTSMQFLGLLVIVWTIKAKAIPNAYYMAGVVEFRPNRSGMTSSEILSDHLHAYDEIIRSNEANRTDIIVFPEGTLNNELQLSYVPAPKDKIIPCLRNENSRREKFEDFLVKLSCIARDVRKYLVINLTEKENCSSVFDDPRQCAPNGLNIYNTNIVFDREGRVISRYRKVHIYVERKNTTLEPEYGIFETDFGVRFGHFICFDILFYTPAQELVDRYGIRDFVFPSYFYSELPFLTATQLQQSWAWGNDVNLLAAGASYPEAGVTGSGIYAGKRGHLVSAMISDTGVRRLLVAQVPKIESTQRFLPAKQNNARYSQTRIKLMKDPQISAYNSEQLDLSNGSKFSRELCYNSFCCQFHLMATTKAERNSSTQYKYRIGIFDGRRTYEKNEWSCIKFCALYACMNNNVESCGEIFNDETNIESGVLFESIEINGAFEKVEKLLIMPNSLNFQLYSLNKDAVLFDRQDDGTHILARYKLRTPHEDLLTFGLYAQYFERSGSIAIGGIPQAISNLITLQVLVFLLAKNFNRIVFVCMWTFQKTSLRNKTKNLLRV